MDSLESFMKSGILVMLALGSVVLGEGSLLAQRRRGDWQAARHGWLFSLAEGKAKARQTGKPLMVVLRCVP
jgi:hypothetical protein